MVAVPATELKSVLDHDIESALKSGALAPPTHGGIVIGVVQHGVRRIFAYGAAQEDELLEIGSISKTFTGLILAQMVEQHKVKFDDPVRDLLPPGTVRPNRRGLRSPCSTWQRSTQVYPACRIIFIRVISRILTRTITQPIYTNSSNCTE